MAARSGHGAGGTAHCWRFTQQALIESPSRADGVTFDEECRLRRAGAAHIAEMAARTFQDGAKERGPVTAACVLFNRFFMRQSFARFDRWLVATACLLTACKVEEAHRKVRDIMYVSLRARYSGTGSRKGVLPDPAGPEYASARDRLTDMERRVLYTLQFDVSVELPYALISAQVVRWREMGLLGKRDEAGPHAAHLDRTAGALAYSTASVEGGLLLTGHELAMCSLLLAVRAMRRTYSALPSGWKLDEGAFFVGDHPGEWLLRDRRLPVAFHALFCAELEGGLAFDARMLAARAASGASAGSGGGGGGGAGESSMLSVPLPPPSSQPLPVAAAGAQHGSSSDVAAAAVALAAAAAATSGGGDGAGAAAHRALALEGGGSGEAPPAAAATSILDSHSSSSHHHTEQSAGPTLPPAAASRSSDEQRQHPAGRLTDEQQQQRLLSLQQQPPPAASAVRAARDGMAAASPPPAPAAGLGGGGGGAMGGEAAVAAAAGSSGSSSGGGVGGGGMGLFPVPPPPPSRAPPAAAPAGSSSSTAVQAANNLQAMLAHMRSTVQRQQGGGGGGGGGGGAGDSASSSSSAPQLAHAPPPAAASSSGGGVGSSLGGRPPQAAAFAYSSLLSAMAVPEPAAAGEATEATDASMQVER